MLVALGVDRATSYFKPQRAGRKWEEQGFSVHRIQSSTEGNQTLRTNGNHAASTQWWLVVCRRLLLITTYSHWKWVSDEWVEWGGHQGRGRDRWGVRGNKKEKAAEKGSSWHKLNQGTSVCVYWVSFALVPSICFQVCFVYSILQQTDFRQLCQAHFWIKY